MYRKFYIDTKIIQGVVAGLRELQSIKVERISNFNDDEIESAERAANANLLGVIRQFEDAISYGESKQDENEQLAAIDKLLEKISEEAGYLYGSFDRVQTIESYFRSLTDQKQDAYGVFAKVVDDIRIKLLAIQYLVKSAKYGATHREKNTRLDMVIESLHSIVHDLVAIDKDNPRSYDYHGLYHNSWDYVKALRDLHYKSSNIDRLQKENEELREKLKKFEAEQTDMRDPEEL